jgi:hypothetical protein
MLVAGAIDLSHAAGADGGLNLVRSEPAPRNEWHEFGGLYIGAPIFKDVEEGGVPVFVRSPKHSPIVSVGTIVSEITTYRHA